MENDLLQRLADESQSYSKRQRAIARYISENSEMVSFMTSRMLSRAAQVSESSVVRFARQMGYSGYSELRRDLQQLIKDKLSKAEKAESDLETEELRQTVNAGDAGLRSIMTAQNQRTLEEAVELLGQKEKIVVQAGLGLEGIDVYLASGLCALGFDARPASTGLSREILQLDEKSALLIICDSHFSGLSGPLRYARKKGTSVLALTSDEGSTAGLYADLLLSGKGSIALAALISALLTALENSCGKKLDSKLAELDALQKEYDTYESGES